MKRSILPIFLTITISLSTIAMEHDNKEHDNKKNKKQIYNRKEMLRLGDTEISKKGPPPGANTACLQNIRNDSNKTKTHPTKKRPSLNVKNNHEIFNNLKGPSVYILSMIEGK